MSLNFTSLIRSRPRSAPSLDTCHFHSQPPPLERTTTTSTSDKLKDRSANHDLDFEQAIYLPCSLPSVTPRTLYETLRYTADRTLKPVRKSSRGRIISRITFDVRHRAPRSNHSRTFIGCGARLPDFGAALYTTTPRLTRVWKTRYSSGVSTSCSSQGQTTILYVCMYSRRARLCIL